MKVNEVIWFAKNERSVVYAYSAVGVISSALSALTNAVIRHGYELHLLREAIKSERRNLMISNVTKNDMVIFAIGNEFEEMEAKLSLCEFVDNCEMLLCVDGDFLRAETVHRRQVDLFQIHDEVFRGGLFQRVSVERIKPFLIGSLGSVSTDQQAANAIQSSVAQLGTLLDSPNVVPLKAFIDVDEFLHVRFISGQLIEANCVGALRLRVEQEATSGELQLQRIVVRLNRDLCALRDDGEPGRFGTCIRNCVLHTLINSEDARRFFSESPTLDFPVFALGSDRRANEPITLLRYTASPSPASLPFRLTLTLTPATAKGGEKSSQASVSRDFLLTLTLEATLRSDSTARNVRVSLPVSGPSRLRHFTASASAGTTTRLRQRRRVMEMDANESEEAEQEELRWGLGDLRGPSCLCTNAIRLMFDSPTRLQVRHLSPVRIDFDEFTLNESALSEVRVEDVKLLDLTNARMRNAHKFLKYAAKGDRSYLFAFG